MVQNAGKMPAHLGPAANFRLHLCSGKHKNNAMIFWWKKKHPEQPPRREKPLIVVVDDEEDLCRLVQISLTPRGYDVETAHDGAAGLELIRLRQPALIVLDIKMPRMNGYQVLARLQQEPNLAKIPVIVMTSLTDSSDDTDEDWARRLGVRQFISKPVDPLVIVDAIESQLKS